MKFAVLIPARNEEAVIGSIIESIQLQDYPKELCDIYVIPNNCTDDTAGAARRAGANIIDCVLPVNSKGDAMGQAFDVLLCKDHDAYCVFDADNYADKNFLKEINNALCDGYKVAKGRNEAKNPYDSWVSGCYGLYFNTVSLFFNKARANLGLSAKPNGTGLAFHRSVIEKNGGWNTVTLTEDAEFAANCAVAGERVAWVPDAVAYDEEPNSFAVSMRQRRRWISGIMQVAGFRLADLLRAFRDNKKDRLLRFDWIMILTAPFVQGFSVFTITLSACAAMVIDSAADTPTEAFFIFLYDALSIDGAGAGGLTLFSIVMGVGLSYIGTTVGALIIALLSKRYSIRIAKSIFMFPVFMFSWIQIAFISLFSKKKVWEQISHGQALEMNVSC
jgi:cellulose synthase/poly-beta-1,6-N-acetylglucosamine synthase-like glycosyltransferase